MQIISITSFLSLEFYCSISARAEGGGGGAQ